MISDYCCPDAALQPVIPVTNSSRDRRQDAIDGGLLFHRYHEAVQRLAYPGLLRVRSPRKPATRLVGLRQRGVAS